jgi:hypothetical protein
MPFRSKVAFGWSALTTLLLIFNVITLKVAAIAYALGFIWFLEEYMADTEKKLDEIIKRMEALDSQISRHHSV